MRSIDKMIWRDEFFMRLSYLERLVWMGLILTCADDQGRLIDNVALIRSDLFPTDGTEDIMENIGGAILKFVEHKKVLRYPVGDRYLIQILNWWEYQSSASFMGRSKYTPPEGWHDRYRYNGPSRTKIMSENWHEGPRGFEIMAMRPRGNPHEPPRGEPGGRPDGHNVNDNDNENDNENENENENENQPATGGVIDTNQSARSVVYKKYTEEIGPLTGAISEAIGGYIDSDVPAKWFVSAFDEAAKANARSWKYAEAIIKRWMVSGYDVGKNGSGKATVKKTSAVDEVLEEIA